MFHLSNTQNLWICFIEFMLYVPLASILIYRFKKFKRHETWSQNRTLRFLWYVQLVLVLNLLFTALIYASLGHLPISRFKEIVECIRYSLGQAWFFLFATIQLLIILLVSKTILLCRKESTSYLKNFRYGFIIPISTYTLNIPMLFNHGKDPIISERAASLLSNTGGLLVTCMSAFCTFWMVKVFTKLIIEINKHEYSRIKNKENIRRWKIYLFANMVIAILIFIYSFVDNLDELLELNLLDEYDYETKNDDEINYILSRLINTVLKFILACILVLLSPYTSLKVKTKRKMNANIGEQIVKNEDGVIEG